MMVLNELDEQGYYWFLCCICGERLYSEWTVAGTKIDETGEVVAFCVYHTKAEIKQLREWTKGVLNG
tara:strand:- start:472 stop:672 length:201 start_codon:yes stop_codon:yes gene_type:complete